MFGKYLKENWFYIVILLYIILPVDLIPDVLPIFGIADDSAMMLIGIIKQFVDYKNRHKDKK